MSLTAKRVELLRHKPGRYRDGAGREGVAGLILQVDSPTRASWVLRYERHGRERWLGLGPLKLLSLSQARERARAARRQLLDGVDPIDAKRAKKAAQVLTEARRITFETAARQYYDQHKSKWRNAKYGKQFLSVLGDYAFPLIGKLAVADIDTGQVLRVLEQKHERTDERLWKAIPETAMRMRGTIERVLDWAKTRGYSTGENPARWRGHLENVLPARGQKRRKHHPALPYERMAEFMLALQKKNGIAPLALEFTILTAARTSETIGARWSEFNLAEQVWTVPANRIKGEREHRVPLTGHVVATLQGLPREEGNPFVFIGQAGTGLSNNAMAALLQRMNEENKKAGRPLYVDPKQNNRPIVPHGFRSAFRDWAAERTNFPNFVVEMALAHTVGDKVEGGYRRTDLYDKRRKLMEAWATYCATPAASSAKVLSLRGRQ